MPAWFDLFSLDANGPEDETGIMKSARQIEALVEEEIASGVEAKNIFLGGFSQGGALALFTGLGVIKQKVVKFY